MRQCLSGIDGVAVDGIFFCFLEVIRGVFCFIFRGHKGGFCYLHATVVWVAAFLVN